MGGFIQRNLLLIGTLSGVLFGFVLGTLIKHVNPNPSDDIQLAISYPGELFFRALKLLILPSVIFSLVMGSARLDIRSNSKIALRTFVYFMATSLFNTTLGVIVGVVIHPGNPEHKVVLSGNTIPRFQGIQTTFMDNLYDLGRNLIPTNIITVLFEADQTMYTHENTWKSGSRPVKMVKSIQERMGTNFLGVIALSLLVGSLLSTMGKRASPLLDIVSICEVTISKIVKGIIWVTPIGVCSLICGKILEVKNVGMLVTQLGLLILAVSVGIFLYQLIFIQIIFYFFIRKNPFKFYLGVLPAALTAFALQSTSVAMPVTLQCLDENVKVDSRISRFVVPLGSTINMDGTALFVTIASIFIAQVNGVELELLNYLTLCLLATAVSIATAATPSATLVIIFIILQALGLPTEDVGLLFSVDWLLDRLRTANNVLGNCYTAAIVEHLSEVELKRMDRLGKDETLIQDIENMELGYSRAIPVVFAVALQGISL